MSAERDVSRIVRSWIRAEEHESADRVLQTVLSRLDTTPQRRSWWPSRRNSQLNKLAVTALAVAAVLAIAVVGYNLLPSTGIGGSNVTPSPTPAVLARGTFTVPDNNATELEARGSFQAGETRADVTGTLIVTDDGNRITVDLDCARTSESGILAIGGTVAESAAVAFPKGSLFAIILQQGSPARAGFMFGPTLDGPCMSFLLGAFGAEATAGLMPIQGTVELGP